MKKQGSPFLYKHEKLHVLYILTKLELGGAQKVCLALLKGLQEAGHTSLLISGAQGELVEQAKKNYNIILLETFKREISFKMLYQELKNFFQLIQLIRRFKKKYPDLIVHTHSTKAGIVGRWASFFAGVKTRVHTVHGFAFHNYQSRSTWLLIYLVELVTSFITTKFVCVSSYDVATGKKLFPAFVKKQTIIRAAVDSAFFTQPIATSKTNEPFIFGTVACFKKQKNLFDLLQAFSFVYEQNNKTRLEVIGDGALRSALQTWVKDRNLEHVIVFHGWQPNVVPFMQHWHTFALTSLWEGLPCAIVEARLLKLPIISYNTGGIPDVIVHKKNGLLYNQKDWLSLAQGMLELSQNATLHRTLQEYQDNFDDFKQEAMVQQHIELYTKLLHKNL